jgi:hypothetical protein
MNSNKKSKKSTKKTGDRKQGGSDFALLFVISGAVILSLIFIAVLVFTSPS